MVEVVWLVLCGGSCVVGVVWLELCGGGLEMVGVVAGGWLLINWLVTWR